MQRPALLFALGALGVLSMSPLVAHAESTRFGPNDIPSLFIVAKNTNRNEVRYGIRLDSNCQPVGEEPVYAYWRQLEEGPNEIRDLTFLDRTVYGIREQHVLERSADQSKVLMTLKATPDRGIAVFTHKRDGKCTSESIAFINKVPSHLEQVFVHVAGVMSVDWIELKGQLNGSPVVERVNH